MSDSAFLIDSGYLSFISKFLGNGKHIKFKIEDFTKAISRRAKVECNIVYFYTAPPYQSPKPTPEENNKKANYDKFISKLKKIKDSKVIVREGRCQKINKEYSQKGVDTLITMDLLKISQDPGIKNILLLTADTDFVPIIQEIKNKKIILIYFTDKKRKSAFTLSNHLWNVCKNKIKIELNDFYDVKD